MDLGTLSLGDALSPITRVRRLFTAGETGVWYDPSDLGTLFQDNIGTTPVTAVGQTVGLMLDKSQGLVLGNESWLSAGTVSGTVGYAGVGPEYTTFTYKRDASGAGSVASPFSCTIGKAYRMTFTIAPGTTYTTGVLQFAGPIPASTYGTINSITTRSFTFVATATAQITFYMPNVNMELVVSNISVKELPGYHATQATSTARPILGRHPITGRRNLLTYTAFQGAIAGTPGTAPTGWTAYLAQGSLDSVVDDGVGNNILTLTNNANRTVYGETSLTSFSPLSVVSLHIRVIGNVGVQIQNIITLTNLPTGSSTVSYYADGGLVAGAYIPTAGQTVQATITIGSTAGTVGCRIGNGCVGNSTGTVSFVRPQLELGPTPTAYQKVVSTYDVTEAGVNDAYYLDDDGVDDAAAQADGGGGTTGFFLCAAVRPDGGAGAVRTIWSDAGTNTGYIVRLNASNQLEIAAGNGTTYTLAATTDTLTVGTTYVVTAWDDGTNLNVQVNSGTAGTAARPVVSAGTTTTTIGKDNGAATGMFNGAIYPLVYVKNGQNVDALDRAAVKSYVAGMAGVGI